MIKIKVQSEFENLKTGKILNKIESFLRYKTNKSFNSFIHGVEKSLLDSGNLLLEKLGDLQKENELLIKLIFKKYKMNLYQEKIDSIREINPDYIPPKDERAVVTFYYKNKGFMNCIESEWKNIYFEYSFEDEHFDKHIDDFILKYNAFVYEKDKVFNIKKDFVFCISSANRLEKGIFPGHYSFEKFSNIGAQHDKVLKVYNVLKEYIDGTDNHNPLSETEIKDFDSFALALRVELDNKNNLNWQLVKQKVSYDMYDCDVTDYLKSELRDFDKISVPEIIKAITELDLYKGIDFSDLNDDNWKDYVDLINLDKY